MFGIDTTELLLITVVALIFIGPKDLPKAMRTVGSWVGQTRRVARHFTAGVKTMVRDAELEEMERKWRDSNNGLRRLDASNADHLAAARHDHSSQPAHPTLP